MASITSSTPQYGLIFEDATGTYLFCRELGRGSVSHGQLVINLSTGHHAVRKISFGDPSSTAHVERDITVTQRLDALARQLQGAPRERAAAPLTKCCSPSSYISSRASQAGNRVSPKLVLPLGHTRVAPLRVCGSPGAAPPEDPGPSFSRHVSYWQLCNGGDMGEFFQELSRCSVGGRLPRSLVLRGAWQVFEVLYLLWRLEEPQVHADLHAGNILVAFPPSPTAGADRTASLIPDFRLMDFGNAQAARAGTRWHGWDLLELASLLEEIAGDRAGMDSLIVRAILEIRALASVQQARPASPAWDRTLVSLQRLARRTEPELAKLGDVMRRATDADRFEEGGQWAGPLLKGLPEEIIHAARRIRGPARVGKLDRGADGHWKVAEVLSKLKVLDAFDCSENKTSSSSSSSGSPPFALVPGAVTRPGFLLDDTRKFQ